MHAQSILHDIAQSKEYQKSTFKIVHKPLLFQQNTLNYRLFYKKSLFGCTLLLISIPVSACARTINVTCHSTVDGVPENSVQDRSRNQRSRPCRVIPSIMYNHKKTFLTGKQKYFLIERPISIGKLVIYAFSSHLSLF